MNDDARTDAALLAAAAAGDDAAFALLVRRYVRAAVFLAAQCLGDRTEAEDVTQDAFVVVYRQARKFDTNRAFGPWLFAIVRRLAANRRSRALRRTRLLGLWGWVARREPQLARPETVLNAQLDAATAKRAVDALPAMQRACFDLVAVRGFSPAEVAGMYDISESTVRQHVFRARTALRLRLDGSE